MTASQPPETITACRPTTLLVLNLAVAAYHTSCVNVKVHAVATLSIDRRSAGTGPLLSDPIDPEGARDAHHRETSLLISAVSRPIRASPCRRRARPECPL